MTVGDSYVKPGSGNVFADLGRPGADVHLLRAELVSRIDALVRRRGITRTEAARLAGLARPDASRLPRRDLRGKATQGLLWRDGRDWGAFVVPDVAGDDVRRAA